MDVKLTTHQPLYPGVNLPLRYMAQRGVPGIDFYRLGSFYGAQGAESELLHMREVAMMILMDSLTDKPDWHKKVFEDTIVAKWRSEALSQPEDAVFDEIIAGRSIPMLKRKRIMTETAFDSCIAELRCKAAPFEETGLVFTINAVSHPLSPYGFTTHNTAVKADSLVSDELQEGLKAAFEKLRAEQGPEPDWHPRSDNLVQDLVHPSLYPFVYGRTRFIQDEIVGVTDAVDKWSGKGEIVPKADGNQHIGIVRRAFLNGDYINRSYWSQTYQWLPANLAFQEDGTVRFTSYINNLHPKKHPEIYRLVEKLIDTAIPAWERVISSTPIDESGDPQRRFATPLPVRTEEDEERNWEKFDPEILAAHEAKEGPIRYSEEELDDWQYNNPEPDEDGSRLSQEIQRLKWREIREPHLPEPLDFKPVTYQVGEALSKKFKDTGLQVIVKMASIELTPEKPIFPAGGWHIEGQMNEHIVATALYYLGSENVTPSRLSFRMATSSRQDELQEQVGQALYGSYERIYGTKLGHSLDSSAVQTYGSVQTPEGRLLAFPNVFQHAVSSFRLQDPTKPGHRRFIALWLVDPLQRIISTGNVPPQQFDWWAEAVFGTEAGGEAATGDMPPEVFQLLLEKGAGKAVKPTEALLRSTAQGNRLPTEIMEIVRRRAQAETDALMTAEEARGHRLALMEERSAFVDKNRREWAQNYGFCEH